jgi:hypothetical protein
MQGFCEKYYPDGVEIFCKTGGLDLATCPVFPVFLQKN